MMYEVIKDGKIIAQYKSLSYAMKRAYSEGAEVYKDGLLVRDQEQIQEQVVPDVPPLDHETIDEEYERIKKELDGPTPPQPEPFTAGKYRILTLLNVRNTPSKNGTVIDTVAKNVVVIAKTLEGDWMEIAWKTEPKAYILYENGKYAERID